MCGETQSRGVRTRLHDCHRQLWRIHHRTKSILNGPSIRASLDGVESSPRTSTSLGLVTDGGERRTDAEGTAEQSSVGSRSSFDVDEEYTIRNKIGLVVGPLAFVFVLAAPTPAGLTTAGQAVGATAAWMVIWWVSEAVPIPVTALLPLVLFPLTGATEPNTAAEPYANRLIFLFLGGFMIAVAVERWELHRRLSLWTIATVGTQPRRIILGFMLITAFLSMWISNSATAMLMMPIGLAVIDQVAELVRRSDLDIPTEDGEFQFGTVLLLSIAYSASIGGVGTLIGSPPNIIFAGFVSESYGQDISFAQWMAYGVPLAALGVGICWFYLTRIVLDRQFETLPGETDVIEERRQELGSMSRPETLVLVVFGIVASGWLVRPVLLEPIVPAIDDAAIAIAGAVALFVVPVRDEDGEWTFLLDWTTAVTVPWGVILLFGGGLSLAAGVTESGLADWIGTGLLALEGIDLLWIVATVALLAVFLTEVTSNTAMTAMLIPILGALAAGLSVHPYVLMLTATTVASFAFMLPVATPPNAIVFGGGHLKIPQMATIGFVMNLVGVMLVVVFVLGWLPFSWGIDVTTVPPWYD